MLDLNPNEASRSKCYFTSSTLPGFIDHEQPSLKKRPFCTIQQQPFSHSLNLILKDTSAKKLEKLLENDMGTLRYLKVYMKLSEVIEGDFFNQYIKAGNILMLSEGRPGIDQAFSLREGLLRLEVDKATFERMGLEGKAIPSGGRKHVDARYAVELHLRLPSMLRGKKGFERIVWAFKNVLNHSVTWLFCDLKGQNDGTGPISIHQPIVKESMYQVQRCNGVDVPSFTRDVNQNHYADTVEILEWLTLVMNHSPRIKHDDTIDPYLSRYRLAADVDASDGTTDMTMQDLVSFQWHGLITPPFVHRILLAALKASDHDWFALSVNAFDGKSYICLQDKENTMTWEYHD